MDSVFTSGKLFKWNRFYIINLVLQIVYFSLTLSKGGFVTLSTLIVLAIGLFFFPLFVQKIGTGKALLLSVVLCVLAIVSVNGVTKVIQIGMSELEQGIQFLLPDDEEEEDDGQKKVKFERIETGDDASNGRLTIWASGIEIWKQAPVFGAADVAVNEDEVDDWKYTLDTMDEAEEYWFFRSGGNMHNSYIQILVMGGAVAFLFFLLFIVLIVKKYLTFLYYIDNRELEYKIIGCFTCLLGAIGANGIH